MALLTSLFTLKPVRTFLIIRLSTEWQNLATGVCAANAMRYSPVLSGAIARGFVIGAARGLALSFVTVLTVIGISVTFTLKYTREGTTSMF